MNQPQAKSNGGTSSVIIGLILGLICLIGGAVVFFICTGWASMEGEFTNAMILGASWALLSCYSIFLSIHGKKKMVQAGRSGALGIVGIIVGILAILLSFGILAASYSVHSAL